MAGKPQEIDDRLVVGSELSWDDDEQEVAELSELLPPETFEITLDEVDDYSSPHRPDELDFDAPEFH